MTIQVNMLQDVQYYDSAKKVQECGDVKLITSEVVYAIFMAKIQRKHFFYNNRATE